MGTVDNLHHEAIALMVFMSVLGISLTILPLLPIFLYLKSGWKERKDEIILCFNNNAINLYFNLFFPCVVIDGNHSKLMSDYYEQRFSRSRFLFPVILLFIIITLTVSSVCLLITLKMTGYSIAKDIENKIDQKTLQAAAAALSGAYMWVTYDLISRARRRDIAVTDVNRASFRFVIATPIALAVGQAFNESLMLPIAIFLGAFPTDTLFTISRRYLGQKLNLSETTDGKSHELEKLQGINREIAERFIDEGITSICQLAYCDPIDLTMRTNMKFDFVVDCVSLALGWIYFEKDGEKLVRYGLRGAHELHDLVDEVKTEREQSVTDGVGQSTLRELSQELSISASALEWKLSEIYHDPFVRFAKQAWH